MATPASGTISLNQVHVEAGGSSGTQASFNDSDIRSICASSSGSQFSMSNMYARAADFSFSGTSKAFSQTFTQGYVSITSKFRGYQLADSNGGSMSPDTDADYMGGGRVIQMQVSSIGVASGKTLFINSNPAVGYTVSNNDNEVFNSVVIGSTTFDRSEFTFSSNSSQSLSLSKAFGANTGFFDSTSTVAPFPAPNATYYGSFRRRV